MLIVLFVVLIVVLGLILKIMFGSGILIMV